MALRKAVGLGSPPHPWVVVALGRVYAKSGRQREARELLVRLLARQTARAADGVEMDYVTPYGVATLYASLGDKDRALEWLQKAWEERCEDLNLLKVAPTMYVLRSDPRIKRILERMGFASIGT